MLFLWSFLDPCVRLILEHPQVQVLIDRLVGKLPACCGQQTTTKAERAYERTLTTVLDTQDWLAQSMCMTIMVFSLGVLVPWLMVFYGLGVYLNLCNFLWLEANQAKPAAFGDTLATNMTVQEPVNVSSTWGHIGIILVTSLLMVDFQFFAGPWGFVLCFTVIEVFVFALAWKHLAKGTRQDPCCQRPVIQEEVLWRVPKHVTHCDLKTDPVQNCGKEILWEVQQVRAERNDY